MALITDLVNWVTIKEHRPQDDSQLENLMRSALVDNTLNEVELATINRSLWQSSHYYYSIRALRHMISDVEHGKIALTDTARARFAKFADGAKYYADNFVPEKPITSKEVALTVGNVFLLASGAMIGAGILATVATEAGMVAVGVGIMGLSASAVSYAVGGLFTVGEHILDEI